MSYLRISIVTPSFNQAQFIEATILSVLDQNYPNFEHIIIDGGSTDDTINILKNYGHLKWVSEPDNGQSDAINKGFLLATGSIIGWLNSDDIYLPGTFMTVNRVLSDSRIDAVYSNYKFIDKFGNITKVMHPIKPNKWVSLFNCYIPSHTFFFKRKIIDKGIFVEPDFDITMDKEFFSNILFAGYKVTKVNEYFAYFRWHDQNKSLDTSIVKKKVAREGIVLINKRLNTNIPINYFTLKVHRYFCILIHYASHILAK